VILSLPVSTASGRAEAKNEQALGPRGPAEQANGIPSSDSSSARRSSGWSPESAPRGPSGVLAMAPVLR